MDYAYTLVLSDIINETYAKDGERHFVIDTWLSTPNTILKRVEALKNTIEDIPGDNADDWVCVVRGNMDVPQWEAVRALAKVYLVDEKLIARSGTAVLLDEMVRMELEDIVLRLHRARNPEPQETIASPKK